MGYFLSSVQLLFTLADLLLLLSYQSLQVKLFECGFDYCEELITDDRF